MKEKVVDIFKEGEGREKMVYLEVDGKRIGTIHLGSGGAPGDPSRVIINIQPKLYGWDYGVEPVLAEGREVHEVHIVLYRIEGSGITGSGG